MEKLYTPKQNYTVLVRTITFNQAKYITDTLDGVALQQTNFPFVHYVIDDCSTDGEQDVIKAWLNEHCDMDKAEYIELELANVILVPHKTNNYLTFAIYLLKRNLWKEPSLKRSLGEPWCEHSEYVALCEGDDYWTHPEKLQKQVDILDNNPDCTLCYHAFQYHYENPNSGIDRVKYVETEYQGGDLLGCVQFQTATTIYRKSVLDTPLYKTLLSQGFSFGDILLFLAASESGRLLGINEVMSIYRVQDQGISNTILSKVDNRIRNLECWINIAPLFKSETARALQKKVIIPSIAGQFIRRVLSGQMTLQRWNMMFVKEIKNRPVSIFEIPARMIREVINLAQIKIKHSCVKR